MASERQIVANRANAARSTGPRTPERKAIASKNRARYPALARCVLLRSECAARFDDFVGYYAEHLPAGPTECALVDIIATARWRSMRMSNIDALNLDLEFERQQTDPGCEKLDNATRVAMAWRGAAKASYTLDLIGRSEAASSASSRVPSSV